VPLAGCCLLSVFLFGAGHRLVVRLWRCQKVFFGQDRAVQIIDLDFPVARVEYRRTLTPVLPTITSPCESPCLAIYCASLQVEAKRASDPAHLDLAFQHSQEGRLPLSDRRKSLDSREVYSASSVASASASASPSPMHASAVLPKGKI